MGCKGIGIRKSEFVAKNQLFKNSWFIGVNNVKVVDDVKFKKALKNIFSSFLFIYYFFITVNTLFMYQKLHKIISWIGFLFHVY